MPQTPFLRSFLSPVGKLPRSNALYDFLACFLIIVSHFANYLFYAGYGHLYPDILLVVAILGAVAGIFTALLRIPSVLLRAAIFAILITIVAADAIFEFGVADLSNRLIALSLTLVVALALIFLLSHHTNKVLIGAFLAMLATTLVVGSSGETSTATTQKPVSKSSTVQPVVLHIILDEHIGLAGMGPSLPGGPEMRTAVGDFYTSRGFRLFARAYSRFHHTETSLGTALNFDAGKNPMQYFSTRRYGYAMTRNRYLKRFADAGYRINVYQSDYFDYCATGSVAIADCVTYKPNALNSDELSALPTGERIRLVLDMYYASFALVKLAKLGLMGLDRWLESRGLPPAPLDLWHGRAGPIAVAPVIDRLEAELSHPTQGNVFFAHLLIPHYPYVYKSDCTIRSPISTWMLRHPPGATNTPESRRRRYKSYFAQIRCTQRKLDRLFDAMKRAGTYDSATIVIHGDHGARISLTDPSAKNLPSMTRDDFLDGFSTLFAVKAPWIEPGIDRRMVPLEALLDHVSSRGRHPLEAETKPSAFVPNANDRYSQIRLPIF